MTNTSYPYIRAWGHLMHSNKYYIEEQVALAIKERAPLKAIFKQGKDWRTIDYIKHNATRDLVETFVARH